MRQIAQHVTMQDSIQSVQVVPFASLLEFSQMEQTALTVQTLQLKMTLGFHWKLPAKKRTKIR